MRVKLSTNEINPQLLNSNMSADPILVTFFLELKIKSLSLLKKIISILQIHHINETLHKLNSIIESSDNNKKKLP